MAIHAGWGSTQRRGGRSGISRLLLGQRFGDRLFQRFTAQILADNISLAVEEVGGRYAVDAVFHRQLVLPALPVEELRPRHALLFGEAGKLVLILIQADADDLEALLVIGLVGL